MIECIRLLLPGGFELTTSIGFIIGFEWKFELKKPIHMKVVFRATDGMVALMISAALSLPCIKQQQQHISGRTVFFFSRLNPDFRYVPPQLTSM